MTSLRTRHPRPGYPAADGPERQRPAAPYGSRRLAGRRGPASGRGPGGRVRIVVLGTGTDVGKTFVTTRLAAGLVATGRRVLALKPIESGAESGSTGDAGRIARAAGQSASSRGGASRGQSRRTWRRVKRARASTSPRSSPGLLSRSESAARTSPSSRPPAERSRLLAAGRTNLDLAQLGPASWLLVASDSLGVLHDLSVSLRVLPRPPDAVVLSCARPPDASTGSNAAELRTLGILRNRRSFAPRWRRPERPDCPIRRQLGKCVYCDKSRNIARLKSPLTRV